MHMIPELVTPVLTVVVGWLVREALKRLKVEINEATYNSLVAAIVVYLLALVGVEAGVRAGLLG
jgi:hypothetical protein